MSDLLSVLDVLASAPRAQAVPPRLLQDLAARLRLHEASERYLLAHGDPFSQRVLRGDLDQHVLGTDTALRRAVKGA